MDDVHAVPGFDEVRSAGGGVENLELHDRRRVDDAAVTLAEAAGARGEGLLADAEDALSRGRISES